MSMSGRAARGRARGRHCQAQEEQNKVDVRRPGQDDIVGQMAGLQLEAGQGGDQSDGVKGRGDGGGRGRRARGGRGGRGGRGAPRGETANPSQGLSRAGGLGVLWTRPQHVTNKKGSTGQPIILRANYFQVDTMPDAALCMYRVDFIPDEERTFARKKLLRQHSQAIGNYIFDGTHLYLSRKLPQNVLELASRRYDGAPYIVKIRFIKEIHPSDTQFLQIFSILLRRCYEYFGLTQLGRNYYNSKDEVQNQRYRVAIWPGLISSIRQHEDRVLMVSDVLHKFLRMDTLYDILRNISHTRPDNSKYVAGKQLLGMVVMTRYNQRTYRIDDIAWNLNPVSKFLCQGRELSYLEYYQQTYQVTIKDPYQPLLLSKPRKKDLRRGQGGSIYLIPELCVATGLSEDMRNDYNLMRDFSSWTNMAPDKRVSAIQRFNSKLFENEKVKAELQQWGLQFSQALTQVRGRVLPGEVITQGRNTFTYNNTEADWVKYAKDMPVNEARHLTNWLLVFPARLRREAEDLLAGLRRAGRALGMTITQPVVECLQQDLTQDYVGAVGRHGGVQLVLCLLPNNRLDRYAAIKRHVSVVMAIPSQMVLAKSMQNKTRQLGIISKIAIQINCKLGGEIWNVQIPFQNTMVVGYDTYHDSTRKGSSWGAVVASFNQNLTRYYGQVSRHANNEELTSNFCASIQNALTHYMAVNARLPERVFVYRDGVGDGQLGYVKHVEVAAIKACFQANNFSPRFSFVVVSKRINTRLYAQGSKTGNPINPPPGTVCDDVITLPERYDFYLVGQRVIHGTVTPTSYNILEDVNSNMDADRHQRLAYKLTYLYYNWMSPVRVPAPCLYAHKLAYITGQAIHHAPHQNLSDKLWYL